MPTGTPENSSNPENGNLQAEIMATFQEKNEEIEALKLRVEAEKQRQEEKEEELNVNPTNMEDLRTHAMLAEMAQSICSDDAVQSATGAAMCNALTSLEQRMSALETSNINVLQETRRFNSPAKQKPYFSNNQNQSQRGPQRHGYREADQQKNMGSRPRQSQQCFRCDLSPEHDSQVTSTEEVEEEKCPLFVYFGYSEDPKEINVLSNTETFTEHTYMLTSRINKILLHLLNKHQMTIIIMLNNKIWISNQPHKVKIHKLMYIHHLLTMTQRHR
uniref:Uncharacterized protein n=1 Tax=Magallana gigas TaxID=29159 RepID=A0A8W8LB86_MAGGI